MKKVTGLAWLSGVGLLALPLGGVLGQDLPKPTIPDVGGSGSVLPINVVPPATTGDGEVTQVGDQKVYRPRDFLTMGVEAYRKADYELANVWFKKASELREKLTDAEQLKLDEHLKVNATAINMRKQAQDQMMKASQAIQGGKFAEADQLLKSLNATPYLTQGDRATVAKLSESLKGVTGGQFVASATQNVDELMKQASDALKRKDFDTAEALARQASQSGFNKSWYQMGKTSPDDVLKAAQEGRKAMGAVGSNVANGAMAAVDKVQAARNYCKQAVQAANAGDVVTAKAYLKQAEDLKVSLPLYEEYTTDKVRSYITQAESRKGGNTVTAARVDTTLPTDAKTALTECRNAMAKGDLDRAEALGRHAKTLNASWGMFGDNPDKALKECGTLRDTMNTKKSVELMASSRKMLSAGQFDEAEKMAYEAKKFKSDFGWSHMGDTPDKLLTEIQSKKSTAKKTTLPPLSEPKPNVGSQVAGGSTLPAPQTNLTTTDTRAVQANQMLAQARVELSKGNYAQASSLANQVKTMNVVTQDKADDILASAQRLSSVSQVKSGDTQAQNTRLVALQKLTTARKLQREGNICDAQKVCMEAKTLGAVFTAGDETPELVMGDLKRDASKQVEVYSKAVETLSANGKTAEANQYRSYVNKVSSTFGVTTTVPAITLPQMANIPGNVVPAGNQGATMLVEAETCLKDGKLADARKVANSVYSGPFNMKAEAGKVLAKIDAAEETKLRTDSENYFEMTKRAFARNEFEAARGFATKVEPSMLNETARKQFAEFMGHASMQKSGSTVQTVSHVVKQDPTKVDDTKPRSLIDEMKDRQKIEAERLRVMTQATLSSANTLAGAGKMEDAITKLKSSLDEVKKADKETPNVAAMQRNLEERLTRYEMMHEQQKLTAMSNQKLADKNAAPIRRIKQEQENREKLADLMKDYKTFMNERKYDKAELVARKAQELDPENPAIEAALYSVRMNRNVMEDESINDRGESGVSKSLADINRSKIAQVDDRHPLDMSTENIDVLRNRRTRYLDKLKPTNNNNEGPSTSQMKTAINIEWVNKPLSAVIKELGYQAKVDIDIERRALDMENVDLESPISMTVSGQSFKTALERLMTQTSLTYYEKHGAIVITTKSGKQQNKVSRTYPVHDLVIPRDDMDSFSRKRSNTVAVGEPIEPTNSSSYKTSVTKRMVGDTLESDLMSIITDTIAPDSWKTVGGSGEIRYFPIGMTLVVAQSPDIHEQIQDLLFKLRELQEVQITLEVRVLTVRDDFFERIGLDFNVLIPDKQTKFDRAVASGQFGAPGQTNSNDYWKNVIVGLTPLGNFTNNLDIPISNDSFRQARIPTGLGGIGAPGASGGLDIGVAFLSSIQVFMVLEAVAGDVRQTVVQAPKITMFNGQTAGISSTRQEVFTTGVTAASGTFNLAPVLLPQQQTLTSGITLTAQAVVTPDRRYVQLTLAPNITNVEDSGRAFSAIAGINLQQPVTSSLNVTTTVMVPDGGTILMGGLKNQREMRREFGPPILSKIPYVDRLFRNTSYGREASTILFMVSPRIIITEEEEEKLGNTFAF